jgi:60 kDa SS-A/Ro ribonucleoprotein
MKEREADMTRYAQHLNPRGQTPQSQKASSKQKRNSAGGYTFKLDKWGRLDRWLILGAEGGTYYASESKLTKQSAKCIQKCLDEDGPKAVERIASISEAGRAPKNDPAIFALAMAAGHKDLETRKAALDNLQRVCRIGTHLFQFVESVKQFRGWGRGLREAVVKWYLEKDEDRLAYQVVKYQQRNGFSHRDVLRLAGGALADYETTPAQRAVFRWIVAGDAFGKRAVTRRKGKDHTYGVIARKSVPELILGYEEVKQASTEKQVVKLITEHGLTHEMVPNDFKKSPAVWEALLQRMPIGAMIRNLGKLSNVGVLTPMSSASKLVAERLGDQTRINKARLHPLSVLVALNTYRRGCGVRGSLTWNTIPQVTDALDRAFYLAFGAIVPTGANRLIALDVSGSMIDGEISGMTGISPRIGSGAMAMTTVQTEANYHVIGFTGGSGGGYRSSNTRDVSPINLSKRMRLDSVIKTISGLPFGGTDCALPMLYALENKLEVDAFEIYTDSETWAGAVHPHEALERYRQKMGRDAKLIVVGMTATQFTIANPDDTGMLDVVGFDTGAPSIMSDFIREGFGQ